MNYKTKKRKLQNEIIKNLKKQNENIKRYNDMLERLCSYEQINQIENEKIKSELRELVTTYERLFHSNYDRGDMLAARECQGRWGGIYEAILLINKGRW